MDNHPVQSLTILDVGSSPIIDLILRPVQFVKFVYAALLHVQYNRDVFSILDQVIILRVTKLELIIASVLMKQNDTE